MAKTLTPKELAVELDTDPRTVRKFLRSAEGMDMKVGKGHRWAIEAKKVRSLKSRFAKWDAARVAAAEAKNAETVEDATDDIEVTENDATDPEITGDEVELTDTPED